MYNSVDYWQVNDVNTNKELYGWFSWYRDLDMSEHTIINLV